MITKELITSIIEEYVSDKDIFLVEITISTQYVIDVTIDSINGVSIDKCIELSRYVESKLNRDEQDFELTVGSHSISDPFIVDAQYQKNIGRDVDVVLKNGEKTKGTLTKFENGTITLSSTEKQAVEGKKRKIEVEIENDIKIEDIKTTKLIIKL